MVYLFLAEGFEEIEAIEPADILLRGGVNLKTVGVTGKTVKGAHGFPITCDMEINEVNTDDFDTVILPGGMPGTLNLEKSEAVQNIIDYFKNCGKLICAICAAPSILGHKNLLNGKEATCYPGFEKELNGAKISKLPAVKDGNFITAKGPGAAKDFGALILSALKGEKVAKEVLKSMQYKL